MPKGNWEEWKNHVLEELVDLKGQHGKIQDSLTALHIDMATLKVKAGIWGLVGGAIPVLVGVAVQIILRGKQ